MFDNLANKLTLLRILSVPVIVVLMYFPGEWTAFFAALIFTIASITDMVDGFIARKLNQISNFGKFLDPLADKILVGSVLVMLVHLHWVQAWIAIVIICRELAVTGLRAIASDKGLVIAADKYGKMKTLCQCFALGPLILHWPLWGINPIPIGTVIMYLAVILTVFSGGNYMYTFYRNWLEKE